MSQENNFLYHFRRTFIYIAGITIIALSISLHNHHGLGNGPIDQLNFMVFSLINRIVSIDLSTANPIFAIGGLTIIGPLTSIGTITMMVNSIYVILYFIKFKNKDIWVSFLVTIFMGQFINVFNQWLFNGNFGGHFSDSHIMFRMLIAIISLNIACIGIVMVLKAKISQTPLVLFTIWINNLKPFKKLNFGQSRIVVDTIFILISVILAFIVFVIIDGVGFPWDMYPATIVLLFAAGPLLNIYIKLYDRFFLRTVDNNVETA